MNRRSTKFGRQRDQRRALMKSLAEALVLEESIVTTLPKAKTVVSYTEKLITKAKKGDLHSRRQVISRLATTEAAHKLIDELVPKLQGRSSGYFRIEHTTLRRGDGSSMAKVSFVDDFKESTEKKEPPKDSSESKKPAKSEEATEEKVVDKTQRSQSFGPKKENVKGPTSEKQAPKRTGIRGNR